MNNSIQFQLIEAQLALNGYTAYNLIAAIARSLDFDSYLVLSETAFSLLKLSF